MRWTRASAESSVPREGLGAASASRQVQSAAKILLHRAPTVMGNALSFTARSPAPPRTWMSQRTASFCAMISCRVSCQTAVSPTPANGVVCNGIFPVAHASTVVCPTPGLTLIMIAGKPEVVNSQDCASPERGSVPVTGALKMPPISSSLRIWRSHTEVATASVPPAPLAVLTAVPGVGLFEHPISTPSAHTAAVRPSVLGAIVIGLMRSGPSWIRGTTAQSDPQAAPSRDQSVSGFHALLEPKSITGPATAGRVRDFRTARRRFD